MRFLWDYMAKHRKTLGLALVLAAVNQLFSLMEPQIFRLIIDDYVTQIGLLSQEEFVSGVVVLLLAGVAVAFISRVAKNFQDYYVSVITQRVGTDMYAHAVQHTFSLPYSIFEDQRSGEVLQKLQKARQDAQTLIQNSVNVLFLSAVGMLFVIAYAFYLNWMIGTAFVLTVPLIGAVTFYISKRIKQAQAAVVKETASLAGSTTETLRNVELVKSLGLEEQEIARLNASNEKILELELRKVRLVRKLSFLQGTIVNATRSALLFLMVYTVYLQSISIGEFLSLWIYTFFIFGPLGDLGNVAASYQESRASMEQLNGILSIPPKPKPANAKKMGPLKKVEFEDLSFAYQSNEKESISGLSVSFDAGETIALVGPSGSGKSTLVKLLSGLYDPSKGKISFNGVDSQQIDFDDLRNRMGLVSQDTQLFAGTFRENLLFVKPDASDDEMVQALALAQCAEILERSGKGLDTKIGEGGIKLSGGEKQRLAIARALLRKPELLVFDEATSALDSLTEKAITETIKQIKKERPNLTMVLVAHRLSTISHSDAIYVLEKGRLAEKGTHNGLLKKKGLYFAMWREQTAAEENGNNSGNGQKMKWEKAQSLP